MKERWHALKRAFAIVLDYIKKAIKHWRLTLALVFAFILAITALVLAVNAWFETNHFKSRWPIEVKFYQPIWIEKRQPIIRSPIPTEQPVKKTWLPPIAEVAAMEHKDTDEVIAEYVRSKSWDYSVAIRIAKSENFWNLSKSFDCSRTNLNSNGTTDYGLFQINSIHHKRIAKHGWELDDMKDCRKNTDIAHEIWQEQGWMPWVSYTTGRYLGHSADI